MKPSEIIDKALTEYLPDAEHWTQRDYRNGDKVCVMGAIGMAAFGCQVMIGEELAIPEVKVLLNDLRDRVAALNNLEPRWRRDSCSEAIVVGYNDKPGRTYDEIRELMEKSRAGLQERGL